MRLTLVRDRLTWLIYGQLAIFGYFLYGFGPAVPLLRDEQHTTRAVASLHGTALALGGVLGGLVTGWLIRRFGRLSVMWLGQAGIAVGVLGLWAARPVPATVAFTLVAGLFGTLVVNSVNAALAARHGPTGPAAISEANAVAAAVGTVSPLIVGASVSAGLGWRPGLAAVVLAIAGLAVVHLVSGVRPTTTREMGMAPPPRRPLPRPYRYAWLSLFATGSVEVCLNLWVADVLRDHAGVSAAAATAAVSALVGGMFVGRLIGVRLLLRYTPARVLLAALAVSATGFTVFWLATVPWLAIAGLVVCGLGNAMLYPLGVALALRHSAGQPDLAAARATYAVGASFGIAPFVLGALADRIGPHPAFALVFVMLAVAAACALRLLPLAGDGEPVGDRQEDGLDPLVAPDRVVELHDRKVVLGRGSEDAAVA